MSKAATRKSSKATPSMDNIDEERRSRLDRQLRASKSAFSAFDTAQDRSDKALYTAIGRLAEFAAAVGNDADSLIAFAKEREIKITKATPTAVAVTKLVVTTDRRKANKYATLRQKAAEAEAVAEFIGSEGGIEACLRAHRDRPRDGMARDGAGRPSAYTQALSRVADIARVIAPSDLAVSPLDDGYFVVVGVRDADGSLRLIQKPVADEKLIKAAVSAIAKDD